MEEEMSVHGKRIVMIAGARHFENIKKNQTISTTKERK
jgi:hypothetical protein